MTRSYKIILADDVELHKSILKTFLTSVEEKLNLKFEILGEAEDGLKLLELYQKVGILEVDLVFSDIRMPNLDGLSALVKIKHLNPQQKMIMVSSESLNTMDLANAEQGESARKALEMNQKMELLDKVAIRLRNNTVEPGKVNSILSGCEKLDLDPIWVAQNYRANGYLKKPYSSNKAKEVIQHVLSGSPVFTACE